MDHELKIFTMQTGALLLDAPREAVLIGGGLPVEQLDGERFRLYPHPIFALPRAKTMLGIMS